MFYIYRYHIIITSKRNLHFQYWVSALFTYDFYKIGYCVSFIYFFNSSFLNIIRQNYVRYCGPFRYLFYRGGNLIIYYIYLIKIVSSLIFLIICKAVRVFHFFNRLLYCIKQALNQTYSLSLRSKSGYFISFCFNLPAVSQSVAVYDIVSFDSSTFIGFRSF